MGVTYKLPIVSTDMTQYYNGVVAFISTSSSIRNSSIFWEAGVFAGFLAIATFFEIYNNIKYRNFFIVINILALFTTQSTSGYFYIIILLILLYAKRAHSLKQLFIVIFLLIGLAYIYINYTTIVYSLAVIYPDAFMKLYIKNASFIDRTIGPIADIKAFVMSPFIGQGLGNVTEITQHLAAISSRTSTLTFFFAAFGIVPGILYGFSWVLGLIKLGFLNNVSKVIAILLFIIIMTTSPLNSNAAIWILMFAILQNHKQNNIAWKLTPHSSRRIQIESKSFLTD